MAWIEEVHFNEQGLIPVIVQDEKTQRVLMFSWANREALEQTVATGEAVYYSLSRNSVWVKGKASGNGQRVLGMQLDANGTAVIYKVEQLGGVACHTGHASSFWRELSSGGWVENEPVLRDPKDIYQ